MTSSLKAMKRVLLDSKRLTQGFSAVQTHNDGSFQLKPSPYDVPVEIIGEYEPDSKLFSLKLNYVADEPLVPEYLESKVVIKSGKNSGRIYQIDVPNVDVHDPKAIGGRIDNAVNFFSHKKSSGVSARFEIAKKAIDGSTSIPSWQI